jgi:hypothetical protein
MALQNENNFKTQFPVQKINELQMPPSLVLAKVGGMVLNMG